MTCTVSRTGIQRADPVIESAWVDTIFLAPLIVGEAALTALHDEPKLLIVRKTLCSHNC